MRTEHLKAHWHNSPVNASWNILISRQKLISNHIVQYSSTVRKRNVRGRYSARLRSKPLTFFIDRITNQRLGCRRSRFDNTFKGNGVPVVSNDFRTIISIIIHIYDNNPLVNSGLSLMVFPWSSTGGLMSYTARRQDTIEYNELSLRCFPGHILGKNLNEWKPRRVVFTDRRLNPKAAQPGSLTSGLSFPSFRYRSGWNSWGLSKALRSCNIDLK